MSGWKLNLRGVGHPPLDPPRKRGEMDLSTPSGGEWENYFTNTSLPAAVKLPASKR
jgi:hypothetical protein